VTEPWITRDVTGPRTHALVLGVSAYEHLVDGAAGETFGLQQLRSAAASAWTFARWLADRYSPPGAPLAGVRLLLAPSADETAQFPDFPDVPRPTRENVEQALSDWRDDCSARPEDVAILYAAGHGVMLAKDEGGFVLLEDFAQPGRPILESSLDVPSVRRGLAGPTVAQQQFFFIDACSVRPEAAQRLQAARGGVGLDEPAEAPPSVAPIYASAAPGTLALGAPGMGTLFSQALIECLDGLASSPDRTGQWVVTDTSLVGPLRDRVMELATAHGEEQVATAGGTLGHIVLHTLAAGPALEVSFSVEPAEAAPFCFARLNDGAGGTIVERSPLQEPLIKTLPAGLYTVDVIIDPPDCGPYIAKQQPLFLQPPGPAPVVVSVS
jgi:caspase domain-containing protein